jgi:hypothetical protein
MLALICWPIGDRLCFQKRKGLCPVDSKLLTGFFDVEYTNKGRAALAVKSWTNNSYSMDTQRGASQPEFWSYQSGS